MIIIKYIRILLYPIALLYGLVVRIRNFMFNIGKLDTESFNVPIISIGNITVGGTGKTPLTEFIIEILSEDFSLALLSRGYKRKTKGVVVANEQSTSYDIGDEPKQILDKFTDVLVTVAEKRVEGIKTILALDKQPDIIVMDDAYQHRYVKPGLSLLVIDYNRPLWKDVMLPAGELREPVNGKKRADIILFSKCPANMSNEEKQHFIGRIKPSANQLVYFSTVGYQKIQPIYVYENLAYQDSIKDTSVLTITGIAKPQPFEQHIKEIVKDVESMRFPDHYQFKDKDIEKIETRFKNIQGNNKMIVTTEKDAVRLKHVISENSELAKYLFYIPIEIKILNEQQEELKEKIITYVKQNKRNC